MPILSIENINEGLIEDYQLTSFEDKQKINQFIENILKTQKQKNKQTATVVFELLTELSDDFMAQGREQLPLQNREGF